MAQITFFLLVTISLSLVATGNCDDLNYYRAYVAKNINRFSSHFYKELSKDYNGNKVASPFIADLGLYMLCFGARGKTMTEMNNVLGLLCGSEDVKSGYQSLLQTLEDGAGVNISIAASPFISDALEVNFGYLRDLRRVYNNDVTRNVDFKRADEAAAIINEWVSNKTNNLIPELIEKGGIGNDTLLILVSAIYFQAKWQHQFNSDLNEVGLFTHHGKSENVTFMVQSGILTNGRVKDVDASFIKLPYQGDQFSMLILLPDVGHELEDLERNFNKINTSEILEIRNKDNVELWLPKFRVESTFDLQNTLKEIGLRDAFSDRCDFSGMTSDHVEITKVIQKAVITVQEGGTEAAAGNSYTLGFRLIPLPFRGFRVDRPFMYVILHEPTGTQLLVGSVYSPKL